MFDGRGTVHVCQHQHAIALVELAHQLDRLRQDLLRIVVNGHADLHEVQRPAAQHMAGAVNQALAQGAVGDDENAYHAGVGLRCCIDHDFTLLAARD